jgi:hypothetical protein
MEKCPDNDVLLFLIKPFNKLLNVPSFLIIKYLDPINILKKILDNSYNVREKMYIIIKFLKICDNIYFLDEPVFFIKLGMELFENRLYVKNIFHKISGESFAQKTVEDAALNGDIDLIRWMSLFCFQYDSKFDYMYDYDTEPTKNFSLWTPKVFENAKIYGNKDIIKWLSIITSENYFDNTLLYGFL